MKSIMKSYTMDEAFTTYTETNFSNDIERWINQLLMNAMVELILDQADPAGRNIRWIAP